MLSWLRTRSRRDLVLAVLVAGGFAVIVGTIVVQRVDAGHAHGLHVTRYASGSVAYDRAFDVGSTGRLDVQLGDVDLRIRSTGAREARVVLHMDGEAVDAEAVLADMGFRVETSAGELRIREDSEEGWSDWDDAYDELEMTLDVTVPRGFDVVARTGDGDVAVASFEGTVEVQTGDGDIAIVDAGGSAVRLQTGDGNVALSGAARGDVSIQTGDGDVAVGRVAGSLEARTGDGDIHIQELSGELRASTGDGDVRVTLARFEGLEIRTGDGDVTIYADPSIRADVDLSGGDFILGDAFALPAQLDSHRLEGALNGGGARLSVRVGDGTIRLVER